MRKIFTKLFFLVSILLLSSVNIWSQTWILSSATYNTGTLGYEHTGIGTYYKGTSGGTATVNTGLASCHGSTSTIVMGSSLCVFKASIATNGLVIYGNSGTGSSRTLSSITTSSTLGGTYTALSPVATATGNLSGSQSTNVCSPAPMVITFNSTIPAGTFIKITLSGNAYVAAIDLTPAVVPPAIKTFSAAGVTATINETAKTITAELPYGTNLAAITPVVTTDGGIATTSYTPTGSIDFSNSVSTPVVYSVTDGTTTVNYNVSLTVSATANSDATLSTLKIDGTTVTGFSPTTLSYDVALPYAYSGLPVVSSTVNAVTSNQVLSQASAIPGSATVTVTAQDNSQKVYTINFTRTPISTACDITSLTINNRIGVITGTDILVQLHLTTDVTSLTPVIGISPLASISPSGAQNFTNPVQYTVTAQDGTQKTYTVTVQLIDMTYSGPYPYSTNFPSGYSIPLWMTSPTNGISFVDPYTGSDKTLWYDNSTETTALTTSVIRLNANTAIEFLVSKCETVTAKLSATGSRTFDLYIDGVKKATTSVSSNTMATLTFTPNQNQPTLIKVDNPSTSGGATLGFFEVTASATTGLQNTLTGITFDGQTIQNNNHQMITVFDATGRLVVTSNKNVNMNGYAKGIYMIRGEKGQLKIAYTK